MKKILFQLFIFNALLVNVLEAQDPYFSQFYAAPAQLNPAMTGVFQGSWRASANYRDQWSSILGANPFRTIHAAADLRYNTVDDDYFAVGITALRDEAGSSRFSQTKGGLSVSYLKQLGGSRYRSDAQYLVGGAQIGFGQQAIQAGRLWFGRQFDPITESINTSLPSGESFGTGLTSKTYTDLSAGLLWYGLFDDNLSFYAGGSLWHANAPKVELYAGSSQKIPARFVLHAGGEMPIGDNLSLLPAAVFMKQGASMQTMLGANVRYNSHELEEVAIRIGAWTRIANRLNSGVHADAVIISTILELSRWQLGFSYDINSSSLSRASDGRGAFEFSLLYTHPEERRQSVSCPRF